MDIHRTTRTTPTLQLLMITHDPLRARRGPARQCDEVAPEIQKSLPEFGESGIEPCARHPGYKSLRICLVVLKGISRGKERGSP